MLINLSNHPSELWDENQINAATRFGYVADLPFPVIDPEASSDAVTLLAEKFEVQIHQMLANQAGGNFAVHIMGELTFSFALVARLQKAGITCLASTTRRKTIDNADGTKTVKFGFIMFREYSPLIYY